MRKNVLALSIAAMIGGLGFAGAAHADAFVGVAPLTPSNATDLTVAEGGVGHILLVPYFNAQIGNMTVLHVVNTDTVNAKAVKVRFRGAANSDDILDFQVFMSPGDVWTAAVTAAADGVAQVVTYDNTCTLPKLAAGVPQKFVMDRLNTTLSAADKANNTREGYVEIFNMADIPVNAAANSLYTAIKHVNGVAPCTASALNATLTNITTSAAASTAGFNTPTGSLMGDWCIINVPETTTFSGASTAVVAVDGAGAPARGNFVHFPQSASQAVTPTFFTADPLLRTGAIQAANYDLPDLSTPYTSNNAPTNLNAPLEQAGKLTRSLAVSSITNEYAVDPGITAKTDWVFSMPTRRYSVAMNYAVTPNARVYSVLRYNGADVNPQWFSATNTTVANGLICVNSDGQTFWSREEQSETAGAVFSPGQVTRTQFCGETSVLAFGDGGISTLGGSVARQTLTSGIFTNGWGVVNTTNGGVGLPILGSAFIKLSNPQVAAGVKGNYGITWPHRFTRPMLP